MATERVLIGIIPARADMQVLENENWYRLPWGSSITQGNRWPPQWFAAFESVRASGTVQRVARFAEVRAIEKRSRRDLLPEEPENAKSGRVYHQLKLGPLQSLASPLIPRRPRRLTFVQTTMRKLESANEFNDLFDDSPYEDELWNALKQYGLEAERQWRTTAGDELFVLDFALFCHGTKNLDIEVDGRFHHSVEERSIADAARDRALTTANWAITRFTTSEIRRRIEYCLEKISDAARANGGPQRGGWLHRDGTGLSTQAALFEERFVYDAEGEWED